VKLAAIGAGLAIALLALCAVLGAPAPTPEHMRAECASAPDPNGCFADAMASLAVPLSERQRQAERRAED
jgi:hypothetical protein